MPQNSFLRRSLLTLAMLFACMGTYVFAQPYPHPGHPPVPPAPTSAPAFLDATHIGSPVPLTKGWRIGVSSDPAAATASYDDSKWDIRDAAESIADVDDDADSDSDSGNKAPKNAERENKKSPNDFVWFRLHVKLAPNHGPLALLMEVPIKTSTTMNLGSSGSDAVVFANGQEIRPNGPNSGTPERYQSISRIYMLDIPPGQTDLTLSIRTLYTPFGLTAYTHFFAARKLMLGNPESLDSWLELWHNHSLFERLPKLINSILLVVLAGFLLALFFTQKGHREYLWLALYELVQAPISYIDMAGSLAYMETLLYSAIFLQLFLVSAYLYFEFLIAFLNLRRTAKWKITRWSIFALRVTAPILLGMGPTLRFVGHNHLIGVLFILVALGSTLWIAYWLFFCVAVLIIATVRRNYEAGVLLIPLVLTFIGLLEPIFTSGMLDVEGHAYHSPLTIFAGPIPIHFASIADFAGLLAIVLIIFVRFQRIHRDRERSASELHAARSVQSVMIPQERVKTPGFEVDSVYTPAAEVGGDFFHLETTDDGGLLVVIGDVAGKGLQAAMNVSMLVGALRRGEELRPAKILEALNRVLVGSESFTTCEAAWFGPNGELAVASAGHLPPYLNSQEINLPGGLPLGVIPNATYDEVRLYLHPGDRVLFLSDGVVEARNPAGDLFGFERVHNLSNQSAFYIADAAKAFGQEDDITVLTVRRLAAAVAAA